jgi:hypothetical protein
VQQRARDIGQRVALAQREIRLVIGRHHHAFGRERERTQTRHELQRAEPSRDTCSGRLRPERERRAFFGREQRPERLGIGAA